MNKDALALTAWALILGVTIALCRYEYLNPGSIAAVFKNKKPAGRHRLGHVQEVCDDWSFEAVCQRIVMRRYSAARMRFVG